jgi:hypothetical protein
MDRRIARRNLANGLMLGLGAAFMFGLTFIVATLYIAAG